MSLLRAERLRRRYGRRLVVDVDAIEIARGEVLAVLGPNGAGKSTLFRMLLLVEPADEGRILFEGREVRPGDRQTRGRLAGVFQRPYLFAGTVAGNAAYGLAALGVPRRDRERRVREVLSSLGLEHLADRPVQALSGGEAQRVALARALAPRPELLLLDEPTANLDVTVRRRFREDLGRLIRAEAGAAILITHDPADAFALADRIAILEEGRIVQSGPPEEIVLRPATSFVAAFTGAELLLDGRVAALEHGLVVVELEGTALRLVAAPPEAGGPPPGARVHVAYRPEDIVLARPDSPVETSAQNRIRARVTALSPAGGLVRVRLDGDVALTALVTRRAVEALELAPGREVVAQFKAAAARAFQAG
ncbi:MAG TPA: ABC transporter ATP-binding protein [Longimicrobiales bacterium]